jgi:hypothetical protein
VPLDVADHGPKGRNVLPDGSKGRVAAVAEELAYAASLVAVIHAEVTRAVLASLRLTTDGTDAALGVEHLGVSLRVQTVVLANVSETVLVVIPLWFHEPLPSHPGPDPHSPDDACLVAPVLRLDRQSGSVSLLVFA